MKEIEILVELKDTIETAKKALVSFDYKGEKKTKDIYFYDPLRKNLKLNEDNKILECCRVRAKNEKFFITYKVDIYNGSIWSHSDEYETEVEDVNSIKEILKCIGLKELVIVENTKHTYISDEYEIVVEDVVDLGCFLEVEVLHVPKNKSVSELKKDILFFMNGLGLNIGNELNSGKPELLLQKKKNLKENIT